MRNYDQSNIVISSQEHYFDENFEFTSDEDFHVAFALVDYDDPSKKYDDISEYGQVKAFYKYWGDDTKPGTKTRELKSR